MRWFFFSFTNPSPVVIYVAAGLGGWLCPIYVRDNSMADTFWKLTNQDPNYSSVALPRTFFIMIYYTLMSPLFRVWFTVFLLGSIGCSLIQWYTTDLLLVHVSYRKKVLLYMCTTNMIKCYLVMDSEGVEAIDGNYSFYIITK